MQDKLEEFRRRPARTNLLVAGLLAAIFAAMAVLIIVLAFDRTSMVAGDPDGVGSQQDSTSVGAGKPFRRGDLSRAPKSPEPIKKPDQIRDTLHDGKTYRAVIKAGFDARVEDKDYAVSKIITLAYAFDMALTRKIESNDGMRVVELRHIETCRSAKFLCDVENVSIDLGPQGTLLLGALEYAPPGTKVFVASVKPLAESMLKLGTQVMATDKAAKAFGQIESLSGKKVRITYVDGVGVESLEPVDCTLTGSERDFLFRTAVLSDCYLLPDVKSTPGQSWEVDGSQFSGFLDPSVRGVPDGRITIRRGDDQQLDGKRIATLRVAMGVLELNASDQSSNRVGSFTPRGKLLFNITDGYISAAELAGDLFLETVSKNHLLFEARFHTQPHLQVSYSCQME
jgi:hypothetical protein